MVIAYNTGRGGTILIRNLLKVEVLDRLPFTVYYLRTETSCMEKQKEKWIVIDRDESKLKNAT
jgi:hypothetical protein